jgi:hypothetical protein
MAGYCGICNTHYKEHWTIHEMECPGPDAGSYEAGSVEDFVRQTGREPSANEVREHKLTGI